MSYLIDTDIIIYSLKGNENVQKNLFKKKNISKAISVITYGELIFGAKKSKSREKNLATVFRIGELFPVIELTKGIVETYGEVKASLQKKGHSIDDFDLLIGSTALFLNYTLVTNNEKHFSKIPDLRVENWSKSGVTS
jgi:tRNA(fMet)-specific endonuclease VapC